MPPEPIPYDIAVIGGGITGAAIARDASLRGISAVLFEKNTFGSGTSSKSSKLIHGGLRYLEIAWNHLKHLQLGEFWKNFRFVFLALRETHLLHRMAPDLIHPIPLLVPIYQTRGRSPWSVYFGTFLYGILSHLGGGHYSEPLWKPEDVLKRIPALNPEGLVGGVIVWDHTTDDKKLVQTVMQSAVRHGAVAYENALVTRYHFHLEKKLYEISVSLNGVYQVFYAHRLINASGPWVDATREAGHERKQDLILPVAGAHINIKKFCECSVILQAEDKRLFFVINRENDARVGTTERMHFDPDNVAATRDEVEYLLRALRHFFPSLPFRGEEILSTDAGIRPLVKPKDSVSANQASREHEFKLGPTGVIHVLGVKLTDHRRAAEQLMDWLSPEIKKWNPKAKTRSLTASSKLS